MQDSSLSSPKPVPLPPHFHASRLMLFVSNPRHHGQYIPEDRLPCSLVGQFLVREVRVLHDLAFEARIGHGVGISWCIQRTHCKSTNAGYRAPAVHGQPRRPGTFPAQRPSKHRGARTLGWSSLTLALAMADRVALVLVWESPIAIADHIPWFLSGHPPQWRTPPAQDHSPMALRSGQPPAPGPCDPRQFSPRQSSDAFSRGRPW